MLWAEIVGPLQKGIWNLLYLLQLRDKFASTGIDVSFEYHARDRFCLEKI
jgi:hypothetical protein